MATQAMGFAGRGRGRARNLSAALSKPGVGSQLNKSPESSSNLESESASLIDVEKPLVSCLKSPTQLHLEELLNQARSLVSNDETIGKLADLLCEKSMEDRDLATVSGEVVSSLTGLQTLGGTFRNRLLNKMQEYFKKRDELRNKNFDRFLGFVTLLCSLFKWLKVNDEPLKALAVPIYGLLEELLDGKSGSPDQRENEIETFHHCMFLVATLLEKCDKVSSFELTIAVLRVWRI